MQQALSWYARNVHHDGLRATWPDPTRVSGNLGRRPDVHEAHLVACAIARALGGLSEQQQQVLALHCIEGLPVIHIADELHRHPSRVYAQFGRARAVLATQLRAEELLAELET